MRGRAVIVLHNAAGQVAYERSINLTDEWTVLHLDKLPPGYYDLVIQNDRHTVSGKIIIE